MKMNIVQYVENHSKEKNKMQQRGFKYCDGNFDNIYL